MAHGLRRIIHFIRSVPFGVSLLVVGLWMPIGPKIGPVRVTLADLAIGLMTLFAIRKRYFRLPLLGAWAVFLVGALGSTVYSRDVGRSVVFLVERIEMFLVFYLVLNSVRRYEQIIGVLLVFVLGSVLNSVLSVAQFTGLTELGTIGEAYFQGSIYERGAGFIGGTLGAFVGSSIVLLWSWLLARRRQWSRSVVWLCVAGLALLALGMVATLTRTWVVATALALSLVTLLHNWRAKLTAVYVAVVLGVLLLSIGSAWYDVAEIGKREATRLRLMGVVEREYWHSLSYSRYERWRRAWEDFLDAPIFGVGMGTEEFPGPSSVAGLVDNHYLELLAETGLVGTVGFLLISGGTLSHALRAVMLSRRGIYFDTGVGLLSAQLLWLSGGVLWGLFGSGKPGMAFFLLGSLSIISAKAVKARLMERGPSRL